MSTLWQLKLAVKSGVSYHNNTNQCSYTYAIFLEYNKLYFSMLHSPVHRQLRSCNWIVELGDNDNLGKSLIMVIFHYQDKNNIFYH